MVLIYLTIILILFIILLSFIEISYLYDIPLYNNVEKWNIFGPVEYTIKKENEFKNNNFITYYKIYYNIFPVLNKIGINLEKVENTIIYNESELVSNYFLTYEDALNFIKKSRANFKYKINI